MASILYDIGFIILGGLICWGASFLFSLGHEEMDREGIGKKLKTFYKFLTNVAVILMLLGISLIGWGFTEMLGMRNTSIGRFMDEPQESEF